MRQEPTCLNVPWGTCTAETGVLAANAKWSKCFLWHNPNRTDCNEVSQPHGRAQICSEVRHLSIPQYQIHGKSS